MRLELPGPFDINTLKNMVAQKQITKEVLVWKEGMASWIKAGQVTELDLSKDTWICEI